MATKAQKIEAKRLRDGADIAYRNYLTAVAQAAQKARDYMRAHTDLCDQFNAKAQAIGMGEISAMFWKERRANELKQLLPLERALLAPFMAAGLGGQALERWIEEGKSSTEQQHDDDLRVAAEQAAAPKPVRVAAPEPVVENGERTFSAAQIAARLEADPREFRAMIRKRGLKQTSYTLADAKRLKKAWEAEQS